MIGAIVFIVITVAILGILGYVISSDDKIEDYYSWEQNYKLKEANYPVSCDCGITSRKYQLKGEYNNICPHCDSELEFSRTLYRHSYKEKEDDDREFPFAPKLKERDFLKIQKRKEEEKRIKKELEILESNDKEIEAWQNIQLKKMEEYKKEAERIERELKESNYEFNKEEFIK